MVIKLEALGDNNMIGSFGRLPDVDEEFVPVTLGTLLPLYRDIKYCFAARETEAKSVGLVPRRMVMREVIVRSLAWMRRTAALRPFTGVAETLEGAVRVVLCLSCSSTAWIDLSSTMNRQKNGRQKSTPM